MEINTQEINNTIQNLCDKAGVAIEASIEVIAAIAAAVVAVQIFINSSE